ncbi:MAG: hypothetical protein SV375_17660 [Thermodesulfobacteriota bacterium]|nr:hypothetical protein [Thermodesulfobacteriota bacterium]
MIDSTIDHQIFNLLDIMQAVKETDRGEEMIGYVRIGICLGETAALKKRLIRNSCLISLIIIGNGIDDFFSFFSSIGLILGVWSCTLLEISLAVTIFLLRSNIKEDD